MNQLVGTVLLYEFLASQQRNYIILGINVSITHFTRQAYVMQFTLLLEQKYLYYAEIKNMLKNYRINFPVLTTF